MDGGDHALDGGYYRSTMLEERGATVVTVRMGRQGEAALACTTVHSRGLPEEGGGPHYIQPFPAHLSDVELDAAHQRTIARVRSGEIAWPRENRPSVYDLAHLIAARAREITAEQVKDYRQEDEPDAWDADALEGYVLERLLDEFDVEDPEEPGEAIPHEMYEIIDDAVTTWVDEQEACADSVLAPVMSARGRNLFLRQLILDELAKMPEGTTADEDFPIAEVRLAELERLRKREGE